MRRRFLALAAIGLAGWAALERLDAQSGVSGQWRSVGGDAAFTRYSPLDQINKNNVKTLKVAWRQAGYDPALKQAFPELRVSGNYRSTPIMVNGVLYAPNAVGLVRAFGPGSGEVRWEQAPAIKTLGLNLSKSIGFGGGREVVLSGAVFNLLNDGNYTQYNYSGANERFNTVNFLRLRNQQAARAFQVTALVKF